MSERSMATSTMTMTSTTMQVRSALRAVGKNPIGEKRNHVAGEETDSLITGIPNIFVVLFAFAGIASGVCSMVEVASTLVDVASICLIVLTPIAIYQKVLLQDLGNTRRQQYELKMSAQRITEENNKLIKEINNLQSKVKDLGTIQAELDAFVQKQKSKNDGRNNNNNTNNTDRLYHIVQEQRRIQKRIQQNLEQSIIQKVLQCALRSDTNHDFTLNKKEMHEFEMKLSAIPGVVLDKDNWKRYCEQDANHDEQELLVEEIMIMFRNLKKDIPETENIFHLVPEQIITTKKQQQQQQQNSNNDNDPSKQGQQQEVSLTTTTTQQQEQKPKQKQQQQLQLGFFGF